MSDIHQVPIGLIRIFSKAATVRALTNFTDHKGDTNHLSRLKHDIYKIVKQAMVSPEFTKFANQGLSRVFNPENLTRVGRGALYGLGAAVPLGITAKVISDNAVDNARDKAVQVGAALAGLGVLYHGATKGIDYAMANKMKSPSAQVNLTKRMTDPQGNPYSANIRYNFFPKVSSAQLCTNLGTLGYMDSILAEAHSVKLGHDALAQLTDLINYNKEKIAETFIDLS